MFDRSDPRQIRDFARRLALASGVDWEHLSILEVASWLRRACALADTLEIGPWRGFAC